MLLIDYSNIAKGSILANLYKIGVTNSPEGMGMCRHVVINSIMNYRKKFASYGEPIIVADSQTGYWRTQVFPQYKWKRKIDQAESAIDWQFVSIASKVILKEIKENFPFTVIQVDKAEADDIIGVLSKSNEPIMCVSADQDTLQCGRYNPLYKQFSPIIASQGKDGNITLAPERIIPELIEHVVRASDDGIPNILSESTCFMNGIKQTTTTAAFLSRFLDLPSTAFIEGQLATIVEETEQELKELLEAQENKVTKGRAEKIEMIHKKLASYAGAHDRIIMNRILVDFDYIPDNIVRSIRDAILNQQAHGSASKAMTYMADKNLNLLLDRINELG